jgi:hypothetical protein
VVKLSALSPPLSHHTNRPRKPALIPCERDQLCADLTTPLQSCQEQGTFRTGAGRVAGTQAKGFMGDLFGRVWQSATPQIRRRVIAPTTASRGRRRACSETAVIITTTLTKSSRSWSACYVKLLIIIALRSRKPAFAFALRYLTSAIAGRRRHARFGYRNSCNAGASPSRHAHSPVPAPNRGDVASRRAGWRRNGGGEEIKKAASRATAWTPRARIESHPQYRPSARRESRQRPFFWPSVPDLAKLTASHSRERP